MLRNILFVVAGLVIFVCGAIMGPKIWENMQNSVPQVSSEKKVAENTLINPEEKNVSPASPVSSAQSDTNKASSVSSDANEKTNTENPVDAETLADAEKTDPTKEENEEKNPLAPELSAAKEEDGENKSDALDSQKKEEASVATQEVVVKKSIEKGDTLSELFKQYTDEKSAHVLIGAITKVHKATSFLVGHRYTVVHNTEKNTIDRFEYEINDTDTLLVDNTGETADVSIKKIVFDKKLAFIKGVIKENPYNTIKELNEDPDRLSYTLMSMFKWDIDFNSEVQPGDSFSVLVEKLYHEGEFKGYGRSIGGTFTNKNKTIESFLYYDANKNEKHYNAKGENMQRFLLRSPLDVIRVTSGFSYRRRHPVYGTYRPHLGLDYGAPSGTRIFAIADGVVTYVGWRGGFGKHITIKHATGLESMYSHLRGYARGIRRGAKVKQGKVIGYVGSTGVSTGPHLDFRLKQNGKYINPHNTKMNRRAASVSKVHKQGYEERKKLIREFMDGTRSLESYDPKMVDVPGKNS